MSLVHYSANTFPNIQAAISDHVGETTIPELGSVVIFGGSARNALLEATSGIIQPIRDIDLAPIGDIISDEDFWSLHQQINPDDPDQNVRIFRYPGIRELFAGNVDFTINEVAINLGGTDTMQLTATTAAAEAVRERIIQPTAGPGDITATRHMLDVYREMNLIGKDVPSRTVEHVVAFCEAANNAKPALKFYGSEVANRVRHTDRVPEAKTD